MAELLATTEGRSGDEAVTWNGLTVSLSAMLGLGLGEYRLHGRDVAKALDRPWPITPDDARRPRLVLASALPLLPLLVDPSTTADVRAAYDLRVRGGPQVGVVIRDGRLTVGADDGPVDCHVSAEPVALLLVSYGRRSQWVPGAHGQAARVGSQAVARAAADQLPRHAVALPAGGRCRAADRPAGQWPPLRWQAGDVPSSRRRPRNVRRCLPVAWAAQGGAAGGTMSWEMVDEGWGRKAVDFATVAEPSSCREYVFVHSRLGLGAGDRVLDVACGSGLAIELARMRGAWSSGIDASPRLVAIARFRNPESDIRVGDMQRAAVGRRAASMRRRASAASGAPPRRRWRRSGGSCVRVDGSR